jgi:hypothetical protein
MPAIVKGIKKAFAKYSVANTMNRKKRIRVVLERVSDRINGNT